VTPGGPPDSPHAALNSVGSCSGVSNPLSTGTAQPSQSLTGILQNANALIGEMGASHSALTGTHSAAMLSRGSAVSAAFTGGFTGGRTGGSNADGTGSAANPYAGGFTGGHTGGSAAGSTASMAGPGRGGTPPLPPLPPPPPPGRRSPSPSPRQ
jgi:hypothetical protein